MGFFRDLIDTILDWFRPSPPSPPVPPLPAPADLLEAHNRERERAGSPPLRLDSRLETAAGKHATWMARTDRLSHTETDGSEAWDRALAEGYKWKNVGENIADAPDLKTVMDMWMNSRGHRANILSKDYRDAGFARNGRYWCVVFGAEK